MTNVLTSVISAHELFAAYAGADVSVGSDRGLSIRAALHCTRVPSTRHLFLALPVASRVCLVYREGVTVNFEIVRSSTNARYIQLDGAAWTVTRMARHIARVATQQRFPTDCSARRDRIQTRLSHCCINILFPTGTRGSHGWSKIARVTLAGVTDMIALVISTVFQLPTDLVAAPDVVDAASNFFFNLATSAAKRGHLFARGTVTPVTFQLAFVIFTLEQLITQPIANQLGTTFDLRLCLGTVALHQDRRFTRWTGAGMTQ